ncbi:MAG: type II secretion system secretin GspD [Pseudomonadota bacterium]
MKCGGFLGAGLIMLGSLFAGAAAAKTVTLNMKGADISAVISTVSEITGKNFIVDPRVKGKITLISSKPLDESALYQVFLTVLEVHGYAAVQVGQVVKIIPDADAKHQSLAIDGSGEDIVTQVLDIKHISAAQLVPIIRPLVPPQGHMAAHTQTNTLIISDHASNIQRLVKLIERIDQPSGGEIEVIPLKFASASDVVRTLTTLQQQQKKDPQQAGTTLVADERTNSILLGGDKADRLQIKTIIGYLDTRSGTSGDTHVIYLRFAQAKDLVPVLTGVGKSEAQDKTKALPQGGGAARAGEAFMIQADESTNALVITAQPDIFRSLEAVIKQLDVRRAQVLVEAIIAEVSNSKVNEMGVEWGAVDRTPGTNAPLTIQNFGRMSAIGSAAAVAGSNPATAAQGAGAILGNGLTLGVGRLAETGFNFIAMINAMSKDGSVNVLSTPNILTMDNHEAEIFVGKEVNIPSGSYTVTAGAGGSISNPFTTFKSKQVGIRLKVKPQISEGKSIKIDLEATIDGISSGDAGTANLVTSQRTIKTAVIVDDSDVVVLGGLITDENNETYAKVPILGDIPLIGYLFRYKRDAKDKSNLMVFLRPAILRDEMGSDRVTREKYNFMRDRQDEEQRKGRWFFRNDTPILEQLDTLRGDRAKSSPKPGDKGADAAPAKPEAKPSKPEDLGIPSAP